MGLLNRNVRLDNGLLAAEVYYNISEYKGTKNTITYTVNAYANYQASQSGYPVLFRKTYSFERPVSDILVEGYILLKTTTDFSNAEDVIEDTQAT